MAGVLIAGTNSGSGKTTISMGIMAALVHRGLSVAPFKVGPDYIDPGFHEFVTDVKSHNLDAFMLSEENLKYVYAKYAYGKIPIIEGVMGMFDGLGTSSVASSAHVSKITGAPVILVIDGRGVSTSAAAMAKGFAQFDADVRIAGIIVNRVSGQAHYEIIKTAVEKYAKLPCLGYLPKQEGFELGSRHLGLIPHGEVADLNDRIERLRTLCEQHIDLDEIVAIAKQNETGQATLPRGLAKFFEESKLLFEGKRIGIAKDIAFTFYYEANLDMLRELGAQLVPFSPLGDEKLPENLDAIYIGGGFPEVFAKKLSENESFLADMKSKLEDGMVCYAECGGFMYLARSITTLENETYGMCGFFDVNCTMTKRLRRFGYITINYDGLRFGAHEFHRSNMSGGQLDYGYAIEKNRDGKLTNEWECGAKQENVLAGYPHVHFYAEPQFARKVFNND
ncbi:MAG: cobyrinate a,c-diamide synthase [Clostridia bacterium]|jgi:cobyrinic acid a,c-diamide synthase|nr:cobyrinate a,c-diamide synthase [Clostridia bacterium]